MAVYSSPDTRITAHSNDAPIATEYLQSQASGNFEEYVQRVTGDRVTLVLQNVSSLQGVEVGLVPAGRRR